jgi:predicted AlkP superfamily pyrophosphatase or phosphodiesterase
MPSLRALAATGFRARLGTVLPAVTCAAQSTFLTGLPPSGHGAVGNGWYDRQLGEVLMWRQHNRLVDGEKVWEVARRAVPGYSVANICWWYAMGGTTDVVVTPRPVYHADGRKSPDCYTRPAALHDELTAALGPFPLFSYWGPAAGLASSVWIAKAAELVLDRHNPDLTLVYLPHLDYDLQRFGPDDPRAAGAARALDPVVRGLVRAALERDAAVVVLSEYGITTVSRPVDVNRVLRRAGLLQVFTQAGMEYLDPWTSQAFALADHQIAHVYLRDPASAGVIATMLQRLPGVDDVLGPEGKRAAGLHHHRSGDLVLVAEPDSWFTYYYWLDNARAPDFAHLVEIHRKPGYDPAELFMDPADPLVRLRVAAALARRRMGFRATLPVVPLDPSCVGGSHGRLPADPADGPVLLCSEPGARRGNMAADEIQRFLLELAEVPASASVPAPAPAQAARRSSAAARAPVRPGTNATGQGSRGAGERRR